MQISIVPIMIILVYCATFISTIPLTAPSVIAQNHHRAIAPLPIAETTFARRARRRLATETLDPRKSTDTIRWDAPNSQTYVILTMGSALPRDLVVTMFNIAGVYVRQALLRLGDRVIETGAVDYNGPHSMAFQTWNTNNHQQTYGVLDAAIVALRNYMEANGYGAATFNIFDGRNEVGAGMIGPLI